MIQRLLMTCRSACGVLLAVVMPLAGCGTDIAFEAQTVVSADGIASRRARLVTRGTQEDIQQHYLLPAGGRWTSEMRAHGQGAYPVVVYETRQELRPNSTVTDHVRKAERSEQTARNELRIVVRNWWFVKLYEYRETYRDIVTPQTMERAVRSTYTKIVDRFAENVAAARPVPISADRVNAAIRQAYDPLLEKYLRAVLDHAVAGLNQDEALQEEISSALEPPNVAERIAATLPPPDGYDAGSWRRSLASAYEPAADQFAEEFFGEIFGAYGFTIFDSYQFAIELTLPGNVLESNATTPRNQPLGWTFKSEDFLYRDYVLHARSRLIYRSRIAIAALGLLGTGLGLAVVRQRRRAVRRSVRPS